MKSSRVATFLWLAVALLGAPAWATQHLQPQKPGGMIASMQISCPPTVNFKIRAQNPPSGWEESANDILSPVATSQVRNISAGRWLLVCGYNVHSAVGLIKKEVNLANCRTLDNVQVSTTGKFVCQ